MPMPKWEVKERTIDSVNVRATVEAELNAGWKLTGIFPHYVSSLGQILVVIALFKRERKKN